MAAIFFYPSHSGSILKKRNLNVKERTEVLRVCAYTRVSTRKTEQGESLENQISYYMQEINENPEWVFAGIYADKDSGESVNKRKDFQRMLADCERGKIDLIVTKSCKRFARNVVECLEIIRRLKRLKVGVYFEQERINTLETSEEFFITMSETIGEHELRSHSQNVKIGIRYLFERGQCLQSVRMLGYERDGVRGLKIIPEEAELVKRVFELYNSGIGSNMIARTLNNEGYKTIRGLPYRRTTILYIIENEKYAGNCILQKVYKKDYKDYLNKGEVDKFVVHDTHPAIVDQDTWDTAQAIRAKKNERNASKKVCENPFRKYVVCGNCGLAYQLLGNNVGTPAESYALKCYGRVSNGTNYCHNRPIRLETMKRLFVKMHNELIANKQIIVRKRTTDAVLLEIQDEIKGLLEKERLFMQMEIKGLLNDESEQEYKKLLERLRVLEDEKTARILQETNDTLQHQQSRELERYVQTAKPLAGFEEDIFKRIVMQIIVVTQDKVRFVLTNEQQIEIGYRLGKYKGDDEI